MHPAVPLGVILLAILLLAVGLCVGSAIGAWCATQPRSIFDPLRAMMPLVFDGLARGLHPIEALRQAGLVAATALSLPPPAYSPVLMNAGPAQSSLAVMGLTAMGGYMVRRPHANRT